MERIVESRPRDPQLERDIVQLACRGYIDPGRLLTHAQTRACGDHGYGEPGHTRTGVDWLREARPELADACNYLAWYAQENSEDPDLHCILEAIRHVVVAYELLTP